MSKGSIIALCIVGGIVLLFVGFMLYNDIKVLIKRKKKRKAMQSAYQKLSFGMSYKEVADIIGKQGDRINAQEYIGKDFGGRNVKCPSCSGVFNLDDDACPMCGAENSKNMIMYAQDGELVTYIWGLISAKRQVLFSIKCVFKDDKLISKSKVNLD